MRSNPLSVFVLLCGALLVAMGVYAWRHRSIVAARTFSALLFSMSVYILGYSLELASRDLPTILWWGKIEYLGTCTFPTIFLIFVIQYTHHDRWLSRRNVILLWVIPVLLLIAKFTDDYTHLLYSSTALDTSGPIPLLAFTPGPLYVAGLYDILPGLVGILLLWQQRRSSAPLYRGRATVMAGIALAPLLIYVVYMSGFEPVPLLKHLDLNAFVYPFWGLGIGWVIFRYRLFDLAPIAREALIEKLQDGVVVVDSQGRVIDANPAAQAIFGWAQSPVGRPAQQAFQTWDDLATAYPLAAAGGGREPATVEVPQAVGGRSLFYDVTVTFLTDQLGQSMGQLIIVHDVTDRKVAEEKLRELSLVDDLTGLNNRRGFNLLATQLIETADRAQLAAALIYADLDGLKSINDTLGHPSGDQALIDAARLLKSACRVSDIVARLGGDEFVIVALESKASSSETILARIQAQLDAHNRQANRPYRLAISFGVARYDPDQPRPLEALLAEADRLMYTQKQGRKLAQPGPA
jgi:diguanylate cyclase (GGDEF)-like protein/PAS domain S-box-containing protein